MKIKVTKKISKIQISVFYTLYILSKICIIKRIQPLEEILSVCYNKSRKRINLSEPSKNDGERYGKEIVKI